MGADGTITLKTIATFKTTEMTFKLNEEFEQVTGDDRKTRVSQCLKKLTVYYSYSVLLYYL